MNAVIKVVSRMSGVSRRRLRRAKDRNPNLIVARHLIYYLCYHHVPESIENISHSIGRKSHSTVTAAVQRMKESMEVDKFAREQMLLVYAALESRGYNTSYYVTPPSAVHYLSSTMRPRNLFKNYTPNN
jgi:O-methyltransferase involved in polyketide biosynthesis